MSINEPIKWYPYVKIESFTVHVYVFSFKVQKTSCFLLNIDKLNDLQNF